MPHTIALCREGRVGRLLAALALLVVSVPAAASAQSCLPADSTGAAFLNSVTRLATETGIQAAETRRRLGIPMVTAGQVTLVTETRICNKAVQAYAPEVTGRSDGVSPSGRLYVVQAGTVYVVYDPAENMGTYWICVVLDSRYRVLSRYMG